MAGRFERNAEAAIRRMLARGESNIRVGSLAREMLLSTRTLQRRLTEEDVRFSIVKHRAINTDPGQLSLF